jgi:hypothetical protein
LFRSQFGKWGTYILEVGIVHSFGTLRLASFKEVHYLAVSLERIE